MLEMKIKSSLSEVWTWKKQNKTKQKTFVIYFKSERGR